MATLGASRGWLRLHLALGDSLRLRTLLRRISGPASCTSTAICCGVKACLAPGLPPQWPAASGQAVAEVPAAGPAELVVAMRMAPWQPPLLRTPAAQPFYLLRLLTERQLREQQEEAAASARVFYVIAGVFLLLTLLHLVFFHYNPSQRANRYFARYALAMALFWLGFCYLWSLGLPALGAGVLLVAAGMGGLLLADVWAVQALYALFSFWPGWFFTVLRVGAGGLLLLATAYVDTPPSSLTFFGFTALTTAEQLRLTVQVRRRGQALLGRGLPWPFCRC